jgi:predicted TIM-barrel fold metal-dependent hydrolase
MEGRTSNPQSEIRNPQPPGGGAVRIVDSHVHFWNPVELHYPWLDALPSLQRAFLPPDYAAATGRIPIDQIVFVEANCRPDEARREVELVERLAQAEPRVAGIVAFVDLAEGLGTRGSGLGKKLEVFSRSPLVKGIRQNIQGHSAGFCAQRTFIEGVREVGHRDLVFDLCATHDQLREVTELVDQCPDTRFVLDHCGKPAIRDRGFETWSADITRLAAHENVYCKLSGLLTEAGDAWCPEDLLPYAARVVECFGPQRVLYGSDWPVLTLAGDYGTWYRFTERFTQEWSATDRSRFYADNAARVYGL